jgi:hypothetical protein
MNSETGNTEGVEETMEVVGERGLTSGVAGESGLTAGVAGVTTGVAGGRGLTSGAVIAASTRSRVHRVAGLGSNIPERRLA